MKIYTAIHTSIDVCKKIPNCSNVPSVLTGKSQFQYFNYLSNVEVHQ